MIRICLLFLCFALNLSAYASVTTALMEEKIEASLRSKISGVIPDEMFLIDSTIYEKEDAPAKAKGTISEDSAESTLLKKFDLPLPNYMNEPTQKVEMNKIQKIAVVILVDESVSEEKFQAAKKITELVPIKFSNKTAAISFVRGKVIIKDTPAEVEKNFFEENKAMLGFLATLFGPLSLIFFGLLAGIILFKITGKVLTTFQKIKEQELSLLAAGQSKSSEVNEDDSKSASTAQEVSEIQASSHTDSQEVKQGHDKFHTLLESDKETAISLLKRLMSEKSITSQKILTYLTLGLSNQELISLREKLSDKERMILNKALSETIIKNEEKYGIDSLATQFIVREMMTPSWFDDKAIKEILDSTSNEIISESIQANTELGGVILNLLPSSRVAIVMESLNEEISKKIMEEAKSFDALKAKEYAGLIRDAFGGDQAKNILPFLDSLHTVIPTANQETELLIFETILKNQPLHEVHKIAMEFFPSHLVDQLPASVVKKALEAMSDNRVVFLLSLEDSKRQIFLDAYGDATNKAREAIDIEIEEANDIQKAKAKRLSPTLWTSFITKVRNTIQKDSEAAFVAEEIIDQWTSGQSDVKAA